LSIGSPFFTSTRPDPVDKSRISEKKAVTQNWLTFIVMLQFALRHFTNRRRFFKKQNLSFTHSNL